MEPDRYTDQYLYPTEVKGITDYTDIRRLKRNRPANQFTSFASFG